MRDRIRIETGSKVPSPAGGTVWTPVSSITRCAEAVSVSAAARERYQSIDKVIEYEFQFRGRPTITMQGTRFVWVTNGHPNVLKIYVPVAPAENRDGVGRYTTVLVSGTGEVADE